MIACLYPYFISEGNKGRYNDLNGILCALIFTTLIHKVKIMYPSTIIFVLPIYALFNEAVSKK